MTRERVVSLLIALAGVSIGLVGVIIGLVGVIVGIVSVVQGSRGLDIAEQQKAIGEQQQANQLLDTAWERLGAPRGAAVIHLFTRSRNEVEKGCREIRIALRLLADDPRGLRYLGTCQAAAGKLEEAVASYQRAVTADATDPISHCNLGAALD